MTFERRSSNAQGRALKGAHPISGQRASAPPRRRVTLGCSKELLVERIARLDKFRELDAPDVITWCAARSVVRSFRVQPWTRILFWWMENRPNWTHGWWWYLNWMHYVVGLSREEAYDRMESEDDPD